MGVIISYNIENIIDTLGIKCISNSLNYWFVRTKGGQFFDRFYTEEFIAIEWDEISNINLIEEKSTEELIELIKKTYPEETRPGLIANYLKKFVCDMSIGDIILIPNNNSQCISFGIIDSEIYEYSPTGADLLDIALNEIDGNDEYVNLYKRRKVKWIDKPKARKDIDPYLLNIIHAHNTIVDANPYKDFINRNLYSFYYSDGQLHTIFNIKRNNGISALDIYNLLGSIFSLNEFIVGELGDYNENAVNDDIIIKSAINSPGPIEVITGCVVGALVLAIIVVGMTGGKLKFNIKYKNKLNNQSLHVENEIETEGLLKKVENIINVKHNNKIEELTKIEEMVTKTKENLLIDTDFDSFYLIDDNFDDEDEK